jgi:polyphosphate kinase 2 (PPK2 family)
VTPAACSWTRATRRSCCKTGTAWLADEQDLLYAQDRWSSPLVFQAMDAADKDGTIKHVMSGVNVEAMVSLDLREARRREKKELSAGRAALFRKRSSEAFRHARHR